MANAPKRLDLSPYLAREPVILAVLTGLAIASFLAVTGLSRLYSAQQESLARRWSARGVDDLNAQRYQIAITEFRTALLYDRDNGAYQLSLAQALMGLNRTDEAQAYLVNLWARQPENGVVNLELARIAAKKNQTERALRYYHNAIYAIWPGNQETERRKTRLELINYLLQINSRTQAESELIALETDIGDDATQKARLGNLFLRVQDYNRALVAFRAALNLDRGNAQANAGAGIATFEMGQYAAAQRYLRAAVAASSGDKASATLLATTESVLQMDPFRPQISDVARDQIAINAFDTAGDRLKACSSIPAAGAPSAAKPATGPNAAGGDLAQQWQKLKPRMTERGLRQNPDQLNTAMNLSFQIERQAASECGPGSAADKALMLIANLHEEN
jgi:tetratricopeptide (TPR) repeat protein